MAATATRESEPKTQQNGNGETPKVHLHTEAADGRKSAGKAFKPISTPTDLTPEDTEAIAKAVNPLVADALALYVKTKNFHWHLAGSHFRDFHLLFDEHAEQILESVDVLAERVRKIGGTTIRSIGHIAQLQTVEDSNEAFVAPLDMLQRLMTDNKNYAAALRKAHEVCDEHNDFATVSEIEVLIDQTERRTWFLYETAQGMGFTD